MNHDWAIETSAVQYVEYGVVLCPTVVSIHAQYISSCSCSNDK